MAKNIKWAQDDLDRLRSHCEQAIKHTSGDHMVNPLDTISAIDTIEKMQYEMEKQAKRLSDMTRPDFVSDNFEMEHLYTLKDEPFVTEPSKMFNLKIRSWHARETANGKRVELTSIKDNCGLLFAVQVYEQDADPESDPVALFLTRHYTTATECVQECLGQEVK